MAWFWRIVGGAVGYGLGPLGAALGYAAGTLLDGVDNSDETGATDETKRKLEYFYAIACFLGHVARVDGAFHDSERLRIADILDSIWGELSIPRNELADTFSYGIFRDEAVACEESVSALLDVAKENTVLRSLMASAAWRVCMADGVLESSEFAFLEAIASKMDVTREEMYRLSLQYYRPSCDVDSALRSGLCSILEVALDASESEIKKAYRRKAHAYHPDRHANEDLATQEVFSAGFQAVKSAYDELRELGPMRPRVFWGLTCENELSARFEDAVCVCFFCSQVNRLPSTDHYASARCGKCQSFLLFEEDLARQFS